MQDVLLSKPDEQILTRLGRGRAGELKLQENSPNRPGVYGAGDFRFSRMENDRKGIHFQATALSY